MLVKVPSEAPQFRAVPHRATGVDCHGSIVQDVTEDHVTLKCSVCGAVVVSIQAGILVALEQAIADQFVIRRFNALDVPEVLTSISQECLRGECATCPGQFNHSDAGDKPVQCVHECHKLGDEEVTSLN